MKPDPHTPTADAAEPGGAASPFVFRASDSGFRPEWDAVVVGAGPAGSVTARELARGGASVLLVEKTTFPRAKVCGCCLNGAALAALRGVGLGHVTEACGAVPLRSIQLAAGRSRVELALPTGVSLSREMFDAALVREATAAGVSFLPGTVARCGDDASGDQDHRPVELHRGSDRTSVRVRVVVAANGLPGRPGVRPGVSPGSRLGGGVVVPALLAPGVFAPGTIYMATGPGGYVGLVRLENDQLDIAAAFDPGFVRSSGGLGAAAVALLARTDWPPIPGLAQLPWKGTPALTRRPAKVAARRLFAVGDAAGYVEPFTGEGMAWAVASAAALAPIARRAVAAWDDTLVQEWERIHARVVRRRQWVCRAAAHILRSPVFTGLAVRTLALLPFLSRPVVAALNRPPAFHHGLPA
ncbi:MAG: NAD-binding protein [Gemmataceae bacterium]|nr:NAD-binding protein [Gemmataceae bacterium]